MGFSFSRAYSDAARMVRERFWPLLGILVLFFVLTIVIVLVFGASMLATIGDLASGAPDPAALGAGFWTGYAVAYLLVYFVSLANMAAMVAAASPVRPPDLADAIIDGFKSAPSLFAALLMVIVGFCVVAVALTLLVGTMESPALGTIVLIALVVIGCVIATKLSLVVPLVAVDGVRNPITAIVRSWQLTTGSALKIFFAWFVFWAILIAVLMVVVFALAGSLAGGMSEGQIPGAGTIVALLVFYLVFVVAINLFISALIAAVHAQLVAPSGPVVEPLE